MDHPTITLAMIVKNEELHLENCLNSVRGLVDEIVIVDTGSTDKTKEIARNFTSKIFDFEWIDDFSAARNESLKHVTGEWILVLDADETLSEKDHSRIKSIVSSGQGDGFSLIQRNYINDPSIPGWISSKDDTYKESLGFTGWFPVPSLRLFKNKKNLQWVGRVHERIDKSLSDIKETDIPIHHFGKIDAEKLRQKDEMYEYIGRKKAEELKDYYSYHELGKQYMNNKKIKSAISAFEKSISLNKNFALNWFYLGSIFLKKNELMKAKSYFSKAAELGSDYGPAFLNLGVISAKEKDYDSAFEYFHKAVSLNPKDAAAWKNIGLCFHEVGDKEAAYHAFKRAISLNPEYAKEIDLK